MTRSRVRNLTAATAAAVLSMSALAGCSQVTDTAKSAASNAASQVAATAKAEASKAIATAASQASASAKAAASNVAAGKLDINTASRADLVTTLQSAGVPADQAGSLADSLIAGRPYTAETTASKVGEVLDKANVDPATIVRVVMSFIGG
jgi:DNA uptake protein ComE-like DNA-binding protein